MHGLHLERPSEILKPRSSLLPGTLEKNASRFRGEHPSQLSREIARFFRGVFPLQQWNRPHAPVDAEGGYDLVALFLRTKLRVFSEAVQEPPADTVFCGPSLTQGEDR